MLIYDIIPPQKIKKKTRRSRKVLAFLVILFLISQLFAGAGVLFFSSVKQAKAAGTTYYVDATNGNDSWDGLAPEYVSGTNGPWKTIAKVNASSFNPGDSILFKRGETWAATLTPPSSGSLGSPIIFGAYGSGNGPKITGGTDALCISNKDYLTFQYINFNTGRRRIENTNSGIIFNYCILGKNPSSYGGLYVTGTTSVALNNCIINSNAEDGILGNGAGVSIVLRNCLIIGNSSTGGRNGIKLASNAIADYDYCLITGNSALRGTNIASTGGTHTDGGHNLLLDDPKVQSYTNNNAYFFITLDDNNFDYATALSDALSP